MAVRRGGDRPLDCSGVRIVERLPTVVLLGRHKRGLVGAFTRPFIHERYTEETGSGLKAVDRYSLQGGIRLRSAQTNDSLTTSSGSEGSPTIEPSPSGLKGASAHLGRWNKICGMKGMILPGLPPTAVKTSVDLTSEQMYDTSTC